MVLISNAYFLMLMHRAGEAVEKKLTFHKRWLHRNMKILLGEVTRIITVVMGDKVPLGLLIRIMVMSGMLNMMSLDI